MKYVLSEGITEKATMMEQPPFGPGFSKAQADEASTMDIVATDIKERGPDYAMFILKNKKGETIHTKKIMGY